MSDYRWFIAQIIQTLTLTGYKIEVRTDTPVHLWMRWTTTPPQQHLIPIITRGLAQKTDKYFCFDNYHDNEEEDPGDHIWHTFIKEPWASCETRWFYFYGWHAEMPSPSASAIFKKHRLAPPYVPPIIVDLYVDEVDHVDGYAARYSVSPYEYWNQIRDLPGTNVWQSPSSLWVDIRSVRTDKYWYIMRTLMAFPTETIPNGSTIAAAELHAKCHSKDNTWAWKPSWAVRAAPNVDPANLQTNDYGDINTVDLSDTIHFDDMVVGEYNIFTFTPAGIAYITTDSPTVIGIREREHDIPDIPPVHERSKGCPLLLGGVHSGAPAFLRVSYHPP